MKGFLAGCLRDNIHEIPKQHSQKIPQTTYTKLPPNSFKDSNGLIEGLLGDLLLILLVSSLKGWILTGCLRDKYSLNSNKESERMVVGLLGGFNNPKTNYENP